MSVYLLVLTALIFNISYSDIPIHILLVSNGVYTEQDQIQPMQLPFNGSTIYVQITKLELASFNVLDHFDEIRNKMEEKKFMMVVFYKTFYNFRKLDEYLSTVHVIALVLDDSMNSECHSHIIFTGQYQSFFTAVMVYLMQMKNPEFLILSDELHESVKRSIEGKIGFSTLTYEYYEIKETDSRDTLLQMIKSKRYSKILNLISQTNPLYSDILDIEVNEVISTEEQTDFINFANCQFYQISQIQNTINDIYCIASLSSIPVIYKNINITDVIKTHFPSDPLLVYNSNLIDVFLFIYILSDIYNQNPNIYPFVLHEQLFDILQTSSPIKISKTSRLSKIAVITKLSKDTFKLTSESEIPIVNRLPDKNVKEFIDHPTYICSSDGERIKNRIIHIGVLYHAITRYNRVDLHVFHSLFYSFYIFQVENDIDPFFLLHAIDISNITTKSEIEEVLSYNYNHYNCQYYILCSDYKLYHLAHEYFDNHNIFGVALNYKYDDNCFKHLSVIHLSIYTPIKLVVNSGEFDKILVLGSRMDELITTFEMAIKIFYDFDYSVENDNLYTSEITEDYTINDFVNDLPIKYPNGIGIFCTLDVFKSLSLFESIKDINVANNYKYRVIYPHKPLMEIDMEKYSKEYYKSQYMGGHYFNIDKFTDNDLVKSILYMFSSNYKISQQFFLTYYVVSFLLNSYKLTGLIDPQLLLDTVPGTYQKTIFGGILFQRNSLFGTSYYLAKYDENRGEMKLISTSEQIQYNMNMRYDKDEDTCEFFPTNNSMKLFIIMNIQQESYFMEIIEGWTYYYNIHRLFDNYYILPRVISSAYGIEKIIEKLRDEYNSNSVGIISSTKYDYTQLGDFLEEYKTIMFIPFDDNRMSCNSRIINYGFTPSTFGDLIYVSLLIQYNDIVIIHNDKYEIWERGIDIANGIYSQSFPSKEAHDIRLSENEDEDIVITELVDRIVELMPDGGFIYTALESDKYHKMLLELDKRSLIDKYSSSTVIGNVINNAIKYPTLYRNIIINAAVLKMLNTTGNLQLIEIADTVNIDLDDIDLYQLDVLSNIDSIFTTLRIIYLDKKYSSNYNEYSVLYSTTFEFASGPTVLDKNNFFQVWWHVGNTVVEDGNNILPLFEADDYTEQIEKLEEYGVEHIFGSTTEEIKYKIIDAIKGKDMIFWYMGLEGKYLCNNQVFTFAPSLSTYSLAPLYFFTGRGVFDCVVISCSNNMIDVEETKTIKDLSNILTINFKGNLTLDFSSDYYIYTFLRFLDDNLGDLGFAIVTIPPQDIEPFLKIFDIIEDEYFSRYSFVFLYSDIMAYIPFHYKNDNFYFLSQYYYDPTNKESVELENVIYDIKTEIRIPYQMIEMIYSTATAARTYFEQLKSPHTQVFKDNVNKISVNTPHGESRLSTDYHFTLPSSLLHYIPEKLSYKMVYTVSSNDNSSVYFNIIEPCEFSSTKVFNIGLIVCPEDISSYPLSDIFHYASSTIQFANDKLLNDELLLSLKHIQICSLNDSQAVYEYIKENNISVIIGYECSNCGLLFEKWINKDEYLILSTNPSVTNYIHPNTFHFGVSPTSSVHPILSLFKRHMITKIFSLYSVNNRNEFYFDIYRSEFQKFGVHIINEIGIQWNVTDLSLLALDIYDFVSHYASIAIFSRLESPQFISLINTFYENNITGLTIVYNSPIALSQLKKLNLNGNRLYYIDNLGAISSAINKDLAISEYLRQLKTYEYDYLNSYTSTFLLAMHYLVSTVIQLKSLDIERIKENFHEMSVENYFGNTKFDNDNYMNHNLDIILVKSSSISEENDIAILFHSVDSFYSKNTLPLIENVCVLEDISNVVHKIAILTSVAYYKSYNYGEVMVIIGSILDNIVKTSKIRYLYQIYDSSNNINKTKELVEKITSQSDLRNIICNLDVNVVREIYPLIRSDQILWYTKHTTGEYCYKNVVNTGPVANQVIYHLVPHLLYHGYNSCVVYYLDEYPYSYYKDAFVELSKGKINVIIREYNTNFTTEFDFTKLINSKIPIVFLLSRTETYVAYNLLKLNHYNFYDTPVIALYYDYLRSDYGYLDGLYFVSQYNKTKDLTHFSHILSQYLLTSEGTAPILSSYLAIQFIIKTTTQLNRSNYTIDEFSVELSKQSVYEYKIRNNYFLDHYFNILRYIADEDKVEIHQSMSSMVEPLNFYVSSSQNMNTTKICDISTDSGIVITRQYFILLLMSFTGDRAFYDYGLMESVQLSLNEVNNENKLPFRFVLLTENMNCNESTVVDLVNKYATNSTVLAIFYSGSEIGKNLLKPIIKENDMLLFYLNINDGEECEKNIIYCSYSTSHFIQASISFYSVNYPDRIYILIARNYNYVFSIMYKLLQNRRMTVIKYENPNESGDIIAENIIEQYVNNFIIWTDLNEEDLSLLSNALAQYELDRFYSINYEVYVPNFRYQQIQYYNITNVDFIMLYSEKNEEFKKYKQKLLSSSYSKLISNRMVVGYTMMKLLSQALFNITYTQDNRKYNSYNGDSYEDYYNYYDFSTGNILSQLYNKEYDGPMGLIKLESNHYLRLNFYARRIASKVTEGLSYLDLIANPFSIYGKYEEGNHFCDWLIDKENGDKLEISPIYSVILLVNYHYKHYSHIYRYFVESLIRFRNTEEETLAFNRELPIFLKFQQVDITEKEEEIEEIVRNYLNNNDLSKVIGIIGGIFPVERDAIIKGIGNRKIIYFYPGNTEAEYCYENVISTGPVNGVLKEELVYHLQSYKGYLILVKCTSIMSEHFYKQFVEIASLAGFKIIKVYEYVGLDSNEIYTQTVDMVKDMKDNICVGKECIIINLSTFTFDLIKVTYENGLLTKSSTWKLYNALYFENRKKKMLFPDIHNVYMVSTIYCKNYYTEQNTYQDIISDKLNRHFSNVLPCNSLVEATISTINLITTTLSRISVYDYNNILTMLHEKLYNSPSGNSVLHRNNFVSKNVYILELNENGTYSYVDSSITPVVPAAYPSFDPNYYGKDCIWNRIANKKIEKETSFVIVNIVYEGYDYLIDATRTHVYITLKFLDNVNAYMQNNNTLFVPYFYIYSNEDELINSNSSNKKAYTNSDIISSFFEYDNFGIVIGCLYPKCRDTINQLSIQYNKVFLYTGINDGVFGSKNTISFGVTFHQSLEVCMDYFGNGESKSILIVVDDSDFGNNLLREFNAYKLNKKYFTLLKILQIPNMNNTYANEIIELIDSNNNVMVINLLYSLDLVYYVKYVIGSTKTIPLHIMFFYNEYMFDVNEIKKLTGDYFFSSFIYNSNNVNNLGFVSLVRNVIDTPISYFMDNNNIALHLVSENYMYDLNMINNKNKEDDIVTTEMFLATIFYHTYSGLTGELSVNYNHNLNRKSYLFEIQDSTINAHVYPRLSDENNVSVSLINTNYYGPDKVNASERKSIFVSNVVFIVIAFIIITLAWFFSIHNRNLQIIKQYDLISINITMIIYYFFILTGILELITPKYDALCVTRVWGVSVGLCAVLITFLVKSLKFQSLLNATVPSSPRDSSNISSKKGTISRYGSTSSITSLKTKIFNNYKFSFAKPLLYSLIVQILYLTIWTLSVMPKSKETVIESDDIYTITVNYKCDVNLVFLVIELFLYANIIIWCIIFSFTTRNINTQFKENIVTLTSIIYLTVMTAILFGAYFGFADNIEVIQLARVSGVCLTIIVLILIQYLPMIYYFYNDNDAKLAVGGKREKTDTWDTNMVRQTHILSDTHNEKPKRRSDFVLTQDSRNNRHSASVKTTNKHSLATLSTPRSRKALSTSIPPVKEEEDPDNPDDSQDKIPFSPDINVNPRSPESKVETAENSENKNSAYISSYFGNKRKMEMKGSQEIKGKSDEDGIGSFQSPLNVDFRKAPSPHQDASLEEYNDVSV